MKTLSLFIFLFASLSTEAARLSVFVKTSSHHARPVNYSIDLENLQDHQKLIINQVQVPEQKLLSLHSELQTISSFQVIQKHCPRDQFTYLRTRHGKTEELVGCRHSAEGLKLFRAFERISPIQ